LLCNEITADAKHFAFEYLSRLLSSALPNAVYHKKAVFVYALAA